MNKRSFLESEFSSVTFSHRFRLDTDSYVFAVSSNEMRETTTTMLSSKFRERSFPFPLFITKPLSFRYQSRQARSDSLLSFSVCPIKSNTIRFANLISSSVSTRKPRPCAKKNSGDGCRKPTPTPRPSPPRPSPTSRPPSDEPRYDAEPVPPPSVLLCLPASELC